MYTFLGPVIRAEVGERIRVTFRNNASRPFSIQPHGVSYHRSGAGARFGTAAAGEPGRALRHASLAVLPAHVLQVGKE